MTPLFKSISLVLTASVIGSLGMAFLKMGSAHLTRSLWTFLNPKLLLGVGLFLFSSLFIPGESRMGNSPYFTRWSR